MTRTPLLTEREAAQHLGLSAAWLKKARYQGRGPSFVKIERVVRYRQEDLDAYVAAGVVARFKDPR